MAMSDAQVLPFRWRPEITFNDRLRLVRTNYGRRLGRTVTQEEMAALLGEKVGTYKTWEAKGHPADPVAFAKKIERITGADPVWLLDLTDGPDDHGPDGSDTQGGPSTGWVTADDRHLALVA